MRAHESFRPNESESLNSRSINQSIILFSSTLILVWPRLQGHPTDRFGGISVRRKVYNRLRYSVREIIISNFLNFGKLMPFVFGEIEMSFWVQKMVS